MSGAALIFDELDDQPGDFTGAVPSPAIFDAVLARLEYGTRGSRVLELLSEVQGLGSIFHSARTDTLVWFQDTITTASGFILHRPLERESWTLICR